MSVEVEVRVSVSTDGADRLSSFLADATGGTAQALADAMLRQWAARYLGFVRRRFVQFSRGGGDWPRLSRSTLLARRHGKAGGISRSERVRTKGNAVREARRRVRTGRLSVAQGRDAIEAILGSAAILRDSGTLLQALSVGAQGNLLQPRPESLSVRVGFDEVAHSPGGPTIQQIAAWHNAGTKHAPQRLILAEPDHPTVRGMMGDLSRAMAAAAAGSERARSESEESAA